METISEVEAPDIVTGAFVSKPGLYTPHLRMKIRAKPETKARTYGYLAGGKSVAVKGYWLHKSGDMWLQLIDGRWVAFVTADDVWGSVVGWPAP